MQLVRTHALTHSNTFSIIFPCSCVSAETKTTLVAIIALAAIAVVGVSTYLSTVEWQIESWDVLRAFGEAAEAPASETTGSADLKNASYVVLVFMGLVSLTFILFAIRHPARTLVNVALLMALMWGFSVLGIELEPPATVTEETEQPAELIVPTDEGPIEPLVQPDAEPSPVFIFAVALLVAAVSAYILYAYWPRQPLAPIEPAPLEALRQEAAATIEKIETGSSLRQAILDCYANMVDVVQNTRGIQLKHEMTAREFEQRLLERGLPGGAVNRLTRLFESARYSNEAMGERERLEAVSCLSQVAATVGHAPEGA